MTPLRVVAAVALAAAAACARGSGGSLVPAPTTITLPVATSLAVASAVPSQSPMDVRVDVRARAIEPYIGVYRIMGTEQSNECGNVYLAARTLRVTSEDELHADVVNRTYRAHADGGALTAEGDFDPANGCTSQLHERWTFTRTEAGMDGELVSVWPIAPGCTRRCSVLFAIHAERVPATQDDDP
jgi:hypothetical protein